MPLPDRAQAHDEPLLPRAQTGLVGRADDGWIEKRGALDGVFVGEISTDEQAARARQDGVAHQVRHQLEVMFEKSLEIPVTRAKLLRASARA